MNSFLKGFSILAGAIIGYTTMANFNYGGNNPIASPVSIADTSNQLLTIRNLSDFFFGENGYNIDTLSAHTPIPGRMIRSIAVYRFSDPAKAFILQDSIILDKKGRPAVKMTPYGGRYSSTFYFYDAQGKRYLDITLLENKYDTLYTLRRFDRFNRPRVEIQYNITRKELNYLVTTDIMSAPDSMMKVTRTLFEPEINDKKVLPFDRQDMCVNMGTGGRAEIISRRTVFSDTSYNAVTRKKFRVENNCLVPENYSIQFTHYAEGNWTGRKTNAYAIHRVFSFYQNDKLDDQPEVQLNRNVLNFLNHQMDSLPGLAWANLREKQNSFAWRFQQVEQGEYGDSIALTHGKTIEAFLPKLWYEVSGGSGTINGFDHKCYAVGYNTPLKSDDGANRRCLAIFEYKNGNYTLIKQSFGAIDEFNDVDDDLLFEAADETNFTVSIEDGDIIVTYEYMRGSASYEYAFEEGNWVLVSFSSSHLTCCQAESSSYDYKTKIYTSSVSNLGDENEGDSADMPRDTTITLLQDRPVMYMDSVTLNGLEYFGDDNP